MYSNVDSYLNKKDELLTRIDELKPSIIALSEILPKNANKNFAENEYIIHHYDVFLTKNLNEESHCI